MSDSKFDSNKQFIAVVLFLVFIIISITCLIFCDSKTKNNNNSTLNKGSNNISNSGVPEIEESEPVTVIVSNNNVNSNTTPSNNTISNSNGSVIVSNKVSNKISNNPNTNKNYVPISYFITELSANKIYVGGTAKINVNIYPSNATNKTVKFSSTNSNIVRVSSDGTITGVSAGLCYINIDVEDGGSTQIQMQVFERNSSNVTPVSNSNNPTSKSNATSKSNSQNNPTSKSNSNPTSKSNSNVNPTIPVTGVSVTPSTITITKGNTTTLKATVSPSNATNKTITWSSTNNNIASVSSSGVVTGKSAGTVRITATASNGASSSCTVTVKNPEVKNGWYTEKGERVYYDNGTMLPKYGNFDYTLYGTTAWVAKYSKNEPFLYLKSSASSSSSTLSTLQPGTKVTIIGGVTNGYFYVKTANGSKGYIWANSTFINLPDIIPSMRYEMSNAAGSPFIVGGCTNCTDVNSYTNHTLKNVTGVNLYGYSKVSNAKIERSEYYAPLLYPVAVRLQAALTTARKQGYNFVIYDTYRPTPVEKIVHDSYKNEYDKNADVQRAINRTINGSTYSLGWFMTTGYSKHSQGIALDMGLTNSSGTILPAQTAYGVLDTRATISYNNANANKLKSIMTGEGFFSLKSEWWHFDMRNNASLNSREYEGFYIR